jgi:hypothetical protein
MPATMVVCSEPDLAAKAMLRTKTVYVTDGLAK